ncbi:hypothetical protein SAMN04489812_5557 [Microlunatus soli]|uniref:Uncharacterized protein n=1 Tax=Microlunatus soli TaxID=630515 RepID=A0A1H2A0E6_9ACTN|nr:hypothetical protein SAMN04489812_5557 [Microlunatus soli]
MRTQGWQDDAVAIVTILYDGLRHDGTRSPDKDQPTAAGSSSGR